jgi:cytosine/adenosine deaminase-related metal-dependent hydrolase
MAAVKLAVKTFLDDHGGVAVVASAACGADILALEAASELGIRTRIILPFVRDRFRDTSVEGGGEGWGDRFAKLMDGAEVREDVVVLPHAEGSDDAYASATERIVAEAAELARGLRVEVIALVIWDERPRPSADATKDFVDTAKRCGIKTFSIPTGTGRSRRARTWRPLT